MNKVSRTITGLVIIILSTSLIVFLGFFASQGIDYANILTGLFFLIIGFFILFNKKEDEIEKIKKKE
jgi:hypothetical protein